MNILNRNERAFYAYAVGYADGLNSGVENNPYDGDIPERYFYKCGYERGVSDYCANQDDANRYGGEAHQMYGDAYLFQDCPGAW